MRSSSHLVRLLGGQDQAVRGGPRQALGWHYPAHTTFIKNLYERQAVQTNHPSHRMKSLRRVKSELLLFGRMKEVLTSTGLV
jgi:hypothetical protein